MKYRHTHFYDSILVEATQAEAERIVSEITKGLQQAADNHDTNERPEDV